MLHLDKKSKSQKSDENTNGPVKTKTVKRENLTKKEWKKLKFEKKGKGQNFEIAEKLKIIWEELRRGDTKPEKKSQLLKQACDLLKGRVKEFTFAHDTVRVLE
ncbi:pumilio domain-containing protein, partial [Nephila pilipes]